MKNSKALLLDYLASVRDPDRAASLFADDGVFELPFLRSLGVEPRYRGRREIAALVHKLLEIYPDFAFAPDDTRILIETPEKTFAEYVAHARAAATGRTAHHLFTGYLVAEAARSSCCANPSIPSRWRRRSCLMESPTSGHPATRCTLSDRVRPIVRLGPGRSSISERSDEVISAERKLRAPNHQLNVDGETIRFPYQPSLFFQRTARIKDMTVISVIVGSTRQGRFSEKPAKWILQHLKKRDGVDARLLDLRDFPMPFFDQPATPAMPGRPPYTNEVVQRWTAAIAQSDGFVFVTPEYNYGPSAVLKNAIDWVYPEWNRKAVGFVSYGSAMGARSVQQLRETAIELQLAPIRSSVHIPVATLWAHYQGGDVDAGLAELEAPAGALIDDLLWWTAALKTARANGF